MIPGTVQSFTSSQAFSPITFRRGSYIGWRVGRIPANDVTQRVPVLYTGHDPDLVRRTVSSAHFGRAPAQHAQLHVNGEPQNEEILVASAAHGAAGSSDADP